MATHRNINFKTVDDMPGGYVANVMKTFSVSQSLAEKYGAIVMLGSLRFGKIYRRYLQHSCN